MSGDLIAKSDLNLRSFRIPIAEALMRVLNAHKDGLVKGELSSLGMEEAARLDNDIKKLTTKGYEEITELRRLGLIDQRKIGTTVFFVLSGDGLYAINQINKIGGARYFYGILYEKERIFRQFMDMLKRRGKISNEDTFEISGMSRPKVGFIYTILKYCDFVVEFCKEGKVTVLKYVEKEPLAYNEFKRIVLQNYLEMKGTRLFVTIDELWKRIQLKVPLVSEQFFDDSLLRLAEEHIGKVELIQGVSPPQTKLLFDKRSNTYFHYLKIPNQVLETEIRNE